LFGFLSSHPSLLLIRSFAQWGDVQRRFKHFDWLHDRLLEKFTFISLPNLPEKVFMGSTDERFVEKRKRHLERYLNRLARHPVVRGSDVFQHFMKVSKEDGQWKNGKRVAEKDKAVGPSSSSMLLPKELFPTMGMDNATADVWLRDNSLNFLFFLFSFFLSQKR